MTSSQETWGQAFYSLIHLIYDGQKGIIIGKHTEGTTPISEFHTSMDEHDSGMKADNGTVHARGLSNKTKQSSPTAMLG